ncbi:MAG: cytochrome c5 family protein [Chlorobiaceae bacterium]|nr:cytochrome c5 family protein [Chlorobiaceae bacterium]
MIVKSFLFILIIGLAFLGGCSPEKASVNKELSTSKDVTSGELKLASGKAVYEANCGGCHDSGVAGAPKPGDKAAWSERIAHGGMDMIIKKSIEGYDGKTGMMPAKGGNASLEDKEVMSAVAYMTRKF